MLDSDLAVEHCGMMPCSSFTGHIYTEQVADGHAEVDLEFTRSGISAMTVTGKFFEIAFSQCDLRFAGVGRRLVFCRNPQRTFAICCRDPRFLQALAEASSGLLDKQIERQLDKRNESSDVRLVGLQALVAMAIVVASVYLLARI